MRDFDQNYSAFGSGDNLKRKSVRGAVLTAVGGGLELALRLASMAILARLLIPEDFGLLAMVLAVTGIAQQFSSLGLSTATIQAQKITEKQCTNLLWINVAAGVGFGLSMSALAPFIAAFYDDSRLVPITLAVSVNFVFTGLTVQHQALLYRRMRQPQIAANRLIASFLSVCFGVILAFAGFGYWALVGREVARAFLIAVGVWLLNPWIPGLPNRGSRLGSLLRFGADMTLTQLLIAVISQLDTLLIGRFMGPVALGLYRQAYNLIMAPAELLNQPIFGVAQPGLSALQTQPDRYSRYYERIVFVVSLIMVPLGVFTAIYAEEIVAVVLGEKWLGATVFLQIFGIATSIRPVVGTSAIVLITCGKSRRFLIVSVVHSLVLATLMIVAIPWGATAIAVAHVAATGLLAPWKLYYSFSGTPVTVRAFLGAVSRPLVASLAMGIALVLLQAAAPFDGRLVSLFAGCGAAVVIYFMTLLGLPGGWRQLRSVLNEVSTALRVGAP